MRYAFQAIDSNGRVLRGVMRAESEEEARELLLGENVFPKQLQPAEEGAKVTWVPKERIKAQFERRNAPEGSAPEIPKPTRALFDTVALFGFESGPVAGRAGLTEDGRFVFESNRGEGMTAAAEDVEIARFAGFPRRILRITLLSGDMYEFAAGFVFAGGAPKAAAQALNIPKRKSGE